MIDLTGYTAADWRTTQKNLISLVTTVNHAFPLSDSGTHICIASYGGSGQVNLGLKSGTSLDAVKKAINALSFQKINTHDLKSGMLAVQDEMSSNSRNQINGEFDFMVVIPIVNTVMDDNDEVVRTATNMKLQETIIIPYSISSTVSLAPLKSMATNASSVLYQPKEDLADVWDYFTDLGAVLCPVPGN